MRPIENSKKGRRPEAESAAVRVALRPIRRALNPHPKLFAEALDSCGIRTYEMDFRASRFPWAADLIILHWPDEFFFFHSAKRTVKAWILAAQLWLSKLRGQSLVWVVHNLEPHRKGAPLTVLNQQFLRRVDGLIFLSEQSRRLANARYPRLRDKPNIVLPHGTYESKSPPSAPRPLEEGPAKLCFIGQVRRYKGPDVLAATVAGMPAAQVELTIAGWCSEEDLRADLESAASPNITLRLSYQSDEALEMLVDGHDAVVLPYRDIMNSGSVLFALSRARPVLAPRLGSLIELREEVGADWIYLYEGEFSDFVLAEFLTWLRANRRAAAPDLSAQAWSKIGRLAADFVTTLARGPRENGA